MKNEALRQLYPNGFLKIASSVTAVLSFARTQLFARI